MAVVWSVERHLSHVRVVGECAGRSHAFVAAVDGDEDAACQIEIGKRFIEAWFGSE